MNISLKNKIGVHLNEITQLKGVENAFLSQIDGNPIQSVGIWLSEDEIFRLGAATSAIFNTSNHLHNDLKYITIEGKRANILIAPLNNLLHYNVDQKLEKSPIYNNEEEFYFTLTTLPHINIAGLFLQTSENLNSIKKELLVSGKSFKPPLITHTDQRIQEITKGFKVKRGVKQERAIRPYILTPSRGTHVETSNMLEIISEMVPDLKNAFVSVDGGFIISKIGLSTNSKSLENASAMSISLFHMAEECAQLLKKMSAKDMVITCGDTFQFIKKLHEEKGIMSLEIGKEKIKLRDLKKILQTFSRNINSFVNAAFERSAPNKFDIERFFKDLVMNVSLK